MLTVNCQAFSALHRSNQRLRDNEVLQGLTETSWTCADSMLSHCHVPDVFGFRKAGNIKCSEASYVHSFSHVYFLHIPNN